MSFSIQFLNEVQEIAKRLDGDAIERVATILTKMRETGGRLFILGVGGSAGNASHACNDFRKICQIEAYSFDNISELTALVNDNGWHTVFTAWLQGSHLNEHDALLILSVGGGNLEKNVSVNLVEAMKLAQERGTKIVAIVGRDGGYAARVADACVIIPPLFHDHITPHSESFQAVIWHLLVSHPALKQNQTKWESVMSLSPAIFLDRDGTLTINDLSPKTIEELTMVPMPTVQSLFSALKKKKFKLVVITNQPDVARGLQQREVVEAINGRIEAEFSIDKTFVCYHTDEDNCACRKPKPGLLLQAAQELGISLKDSFMVGNRWSDVEAGAAAGCRTVLITQDSNLHRIDKLVYPWRHSTTLDEALRLILEDSNEH